MNKKSIRKIMVIVLAFTFIVSYSDYVEASKISKKNIQNLQNFVVGEMWNDCICNFHWYYEYRTDNCGNKMDPEKNLKKFNKVMKKAKKWDKVVKGLKGKKYKKLKKHWKVAYSEAKKIQKTLNAADFDKMKESNKSYKLKYEKFQKYMYKISEDLL